MEKSQYIAIALSVVLFGTLFALPRVVVNNQDEADKLAAGSGEKHMQSGLSGEQGSKVADLRNVLASEEDTETRMIALLDLIGLYKSANLFDSAAYIAEEEALRSPKMGNALLAADLYYDAYTYALDPDRIRRFAESARGWYEKVLLEKPDSTDLKVKLGMTYLTTENPMQGIMLIRSVLEKDPDNRFALSNMGLLSMQSGQYEKALERFERIKEIDPSDLQNRFYLAICLKETGKTPQAIAEMEHVKANESDPDVLTTVSRYLEEWTAKQ